MLSFADFLLLRYLNENIAAGRVQHNVSVPFAKQFAKNVNKLRYVIDADNRLHIGNADRFTHDQILPHEYNNINGYLEYNPREKIWKHHVRYQDENEYDLTHRIRRSPLLGKMEKLGIKRANRALEFEW